MAAVNPVYDLLVEALACADKLAVADGSRWLGDAVNRAYEAVELPDWLPKFETLVEAMGLESAPSDYAPRWQREQEAEKSP